MNINFIMKPKFYIPSTIDPKIDFVTFWALWADGGHRVSNKNVCNFVSKSILLLRLLDQYFHGQKNKQSNIFCTF